MNESWNKVSEAKDGLVKSFQVSSEVAELERKIEVQKNNKSVAYQKIGQLFYEKNGSDPIPKEYQDLFSEIQAADTEIDTLSRKILLAKNLVICPTCHKECGFEMSFCGYCGCNLADAKAELDPTPKCPECGAVLIEGAMFCGVCGARLEGTSEVAEECEMNPIGSP